MKYNSNLFLSLSIIAWLALSTFCQPAAAETSWQLRVGGLWLDSDGKSEQVLLDGGRAQTSIEPEFGLTATTELRLNERVGIEFGALVIASPELRARVDSSFGDTEARDSFDMYMFGAGINFHLTPQKKVDLYVGPFVGHTIFSDLVFVISDDDVRFGISDEIAYGAVIGIDVPVSDAWSWSVAARYYDLEIEPRELLGNAADPIELDSVSLSLGLGYRF